MKYIYDHDFHIHSELSSCSRDPEQSPERILAYAKENGLKKIVITDHFWDDKVDGASNWYKPQNLEHISASLPLPQADGIEFLFGCETDYDKFCTVGVAKETLDKFAFIIIPTTHMHMVDFTISREDAESSEARAKLWIARLDNLFIGVDMMDDAEKFEVWYSKDFDEYRLAIQYNLGVQYAYGDEIVLGGLA